MFFLNEFPNGFSRLKRDLDYVVNRVGQDWLILKGQTLLITGGTGIIGKWLIASILCADDFFDLNVKVTVLSRDPQKFLRSFPEWVADKRLFWIKGDVKTITFPKDLYFSYIIHAATDVVAPSSQQDILETSILGTRQILSVARKCHAAKMLLISSGAVYGKTPLELGAIPESFVGVLNFLSKDAAYAQGKRVAELMCCIENAKGPLAITIARCFAMVGPYLPLDKHFAIGNFIAAGMQKLPITIEGDGSPVRSYLYMADVSVYLWSLLLNGKDGVAYNVGSDVPISIIDLANLVKLTLGSDAEIFVKNEKPHGEHANIYYPETLRIRNELNLSPGIDLREAILKTAKWHLLNQS